MMMRKLSRSDSEPTREPCESVQSTEPISVPYIVHEGIQARFERMLKRLWITNIILIILLVATNVGWLIYESQFQVVQSYDVEQEAEGDGEYHLTGGDTNVGETTCDDGENKSKKEWFKK